MIRRKLKEAWWWLRDAAQFLWERPARLLVVLLALGGGFAAGYPFGDAGFDYSWRDPTFCANCHVHDYANEAYFRSVHVGVTTCHDCHKVPFLHLPLELGMMVTNRPQTEADIGPTHVESVTCGTCHLAEGHYEELSGPMTEDLWKEIVKVDHSELHEVHFNAESRDPGAYLGSTHPNGETPAEGSEDEGPAAGDEGEADEGEGAEHEADEGESGEHEAEEGGHHEESMVIACLDCHGSGGNQASHRFTATRENCLECHGGVDVAVGRLAELRCQECHFSGFVGVRPGDERQAAADVPPAEPE